jgi:hypothetical protein
VGGKKIYCVCINYGQFNGSQLFNVSYDGCSFAGRSHIAYHFDFNPGILCLAPDPKKMDQ